MFAYDLRLALDSMKRHPGLAALMVLAIALGIAVCTVTFTIYHAMATNPIPEKSAQLHAVTLDSGAPERPYDDEKPESPPQLLTYRDAMFLYGAKAAPAARSCTSRARCCCRSERASSHSRRCSV